MKKQNEYLKILKSELDQSGVRKVIRNARKFVRMSDFNHHLTGSEHGIMRDRDVFGFSRHEMLGVVAVLSEKFDGQLTVNEDDVYGRLFGRKDFMELEAEYLVGSFRFSHPYQFTFLV